MLPSAVLTLCLVVLAGFAVGLRAVTELAAAGALALGLLTVAASIVVGLAGVALWRLSPRSHQEHNTRPWRCEFVRWLNRAAERPFNALSVGALLAFGCSALFPPLVVECNPGAELVVAGTNIACPGSQRATVHPRWTPFTRIAVTNDGRRGHVMLYPWIGGSISPSTMSPIPQRLYFPDPKSLISWVSESDQPYLSHTKKDPPEVKTVRSSFFLRLTFKDNRESVDLPLYVEGVLMGEGPLRPDLCAQWRQAVEATQYASLPCAPRSFAGDPDEIATVEWLNEFGKLTPVHCEGDLCSIHVL